MVETIIVELSDVSAFRFEYLRYISYERRIKINNLKSDLDKKRSLVSELLIKRVSSERLKIPINEVKISYNPYGKPYLANVRQFKFNISHSGKFIVISTSKKRIGIDIEEIRDIDLNIAKRFFTKNEYAYILSQSSNYDKIVTFYKIWTLKESYVKAIGKGLRIPLNSFEFQISDDIRIRCHQNNKNYNFFTHNFDDYILSQCCCEPDFNYEYNKLSEEELYHFYNITYK